MKNPFRRIKLAIVVLMIIGAIVTWSTYVVLWHQQLLPWRPVWADPTKLSADFAIIGSLVGAAALILLWLQIRVQTGESKRALLLNMLDRALVLFQQRQEQATERRRVAREKMEIQDAKTFREHLAAGAYSDGFIPKSKGYYEIRSTNYAYKPLSSWCRFAMSTTNLSPDLEETHQAYASFIVTAMDSEQHVFLELLHRIDRRADATREFQAHRHLIDYILKFAREDWEDVVAKNRESLEACDVQVDVARSGGTIQPTPDIQHGDMDVYKDR